MTEPKHPLVGERELGRLLATMDPVLDPVRYAFCRRPDALVPPGMTLLGLFREAEGVTVIIDAASAERSGYVADFLARRIILTVHSDLAAIGFLARISAALAAAGIPVNPVSAIYHDHLFVPVTDADSAMGILRQLQQSSAAPLGRLPTGPTVVQPILALDYLADHPEDIPTLARWHHAEWGSLVANWPLEVAEAELRSHCGRRVMPTTIVARSGGTLVGSASLLDEDMPDFPPLSPWLGSVFVAAEWRGRGIGGRLVARVIEEARALGMERLHLFTTEAEGYYAFRGWQVLHPISAGGRPGVIMHLRLSPIPV